MITALDLMGRPAMDKDEKLMVRVANKTAKSMYKHRFEEPLKSNWDKPVEDVNLADVERDVVQAIFTKYDLKRDFEN